MKIHFYLKLCQFAPLIHRDQRGNAHKDAAGETRRRYPLLGQSHALLPIICLTSPRSLDEESQHSSIRDVYVQHLRVSANRM